MTATDYPAVAVLGPTGSGKSRLGLELALEFQGEIVSCDALQVYRGMDIGTAKASRAERARIPHHLLDLREPGDDFSAGDYQRLARDALRGIRDRNNIPFVVGGTGFYFRALTEGFFEGPGRSPWLRDRMRRIVNRRGPKWLHSALGNVDPAAAGRISPADSSRIIRAYEIYLVTGKAMTWWQQQPNDSLRGFRWLKLGILWPREKLYERINNRVDEMMAGGLVEEVRSLQSGYSRDFHAFKAIGYRQMADYLASRVPLDKAVEDTRLQSRHYAKRQLTWFRAMGDLIWIDGAQDWETIRKQALKLAGEFLRS
jgi:tRNA dimethylallyltransferase